MMIRLAHNIAVSLHRTRKRHVQYFRGKGRGKQEEEGGSKGIKTHRNEDLFFHSTLQGKTFHVSSTSVKKQPNEEWMSPPLGLLCYLCRTETGITFFSLFLSLSIAHYTGRLDWTVRHNNHSCCLGRGKKNLSYPDSLLISLDVCECEKFSDLILYPFRVVPGKMVWVLNRPTVLLSSVLRNVPPGVCDAGFRAALVALGCYPMLS